MKAIALLIILIFFAGIKAHGNTALEAKLQSFYENPARFMNTLPVNHLEDRKFSHREILEKDFVRAKSHVRDEILNNLDPSTPEYNDRVESLFQGETLIETLQEMESLKLTEAEVMTKPWSDDYWPIYQGILGKRYADESFAYKDDWSEYHQYVIDRPYMMIFKSGRDKEVDELGPSEKYDLLFGGNVNLTGKMWKEGKTYWQRYGSVETWMGICHGWAPASFSLARPENVITVKAFDGKTDLNFYPSDIKALASLLWANVRVPTLFVGGRCNVKNPETDDEGRIIDQECFDTNPATWHRAVVEQVGRRGKSFVFDATYDYQVWNQPVISYEYTYFNPQSLEEPVSLKNAIIPIEKFERDVFKKYRSSKTRYVVGIEMDITYLVETDPSQLPYDDESQDIHRTMSYMYDLELDKDLKIIGGEWYQNYHPDFIWMPRPGARAQSIGDFSIGNEETWNLDMSAPKSWARPAAISAKRGQPLSKVVEFLIQKSRQ
ncbi:MAG: hypothetical protein KC493_01485 [Bacteriovoracaceae bacterium]|nr:hypothetical protein [Bacteriovoracaceae bacterium]